MPKRKSADGDKIETSQLYFDPTQRISNLIHLGLRRCFNPEKETQKINPIKMFSEGEGLNHSNDIKICSISEFALSSVEPRWGGLKSQFIDFLDKRYEQSELSVSSGKIKILLLVMAYHIFL